MPNREARVQALAARDDYQVRPTSLISYRSGGKILVLGAGEALGFCDELPESIDLNRIDCDSTTVAIEGHLGAFKVTLTDAHGNVSTHQADALLDLHDSALLNRELPPPGYFHAAPDSRDAAALGAELGDLAGEFEKPKYFDYDASICAHAVNGKEVCRRCIDACPAEAIHSLGEIIAVDANLCQGGGSCSTACPSGAIRYLYPELRDQGGRVRKMLEVYRQQGGLRPVLLVHAQQHPVDAYLEAYDNLLPLPVEELASVGMDLCLTALTYGATQVVLVADDEVPASARSILQQQLEWLHALLAAFGFGSGHVSLCHDQEPLPEVDEIQLPKAMILDTPSGKRQAIYQALDHLVAQLQPATDRIDLPSSAPFGQVGIDADKCTLCMACIGACPGRALQDGSNREVPEVFFIESNCLQCGACVQTCPEDAMQLSPRLLFDREQRNRSRALNRDIPFACIACGKPFAPTSVINKMQEKLKDHHMFGSQRALDRLKMCDDCRVADVVQDPEAMGSQFDPLKRFQ